MKMDMGDRSFLDKNDVLWIDRPKNGWVVIGDRTFRAGDFIADMKPHLQGLGNAKEMLLGEGLECEVLRPGSNWQKGKVRLCLEFCPDQPESPLDDLRQNLQAADG